MKEELKFTDDHIWIKPEGKTATIGITGYAQEELGDIMTVDLPEVDEKVEKGDSCGEIESIKTVTEIVSPVTGTILDINVDIKDNPAMINDDPYGDGWLFQISLDDPSELDSLMTQDEYEKHTEGK